MREFGIRREKPGESSGIQGADRIGINAFMRERDNVRDAEDLQVRGREAVAQQFDRR